MDVKRAPKSKKGQYVAWGAGILAIVAVLATRRAPRWLRVILVAGLVGIACGAGALGYRYYQQPITLSVAAGSIDGDAPKLMTAIAGRLAAANAPIRLKVVEKVTALESAEAFAKGETDLAVVRPDVGDLSSARAVMIVARAVVLRLEVGDEDREADARRHDQEVEDRDEAELEAGQIDRAHRRRTSPMSAMSRRKNTDSMPSASTRSLRERSGTWYRW